jgi:hypothetical protein
MFANPNCSHGKYYHCTPTSRVHALKTKWTTLLRYTLVLLQINTQIMSRWKMTQHILQITGNAGKQSHFEDSSVSQTSSVCSNLHAFFLCYQNGRGLENMWGNEVLLCRKSVLTSKAQSLAHARPGLAFKSPHFVSAVLLSPRSIRRLLKHKHCSLCGTNWIFTYISVN